MRPGLVPVFLFAFYKHVEDEIAFYENGTFVRDLSFETVERLLKSAEKGQDAFTMQHVEIDDARAEVLATLAPLLGLAATTRPLPVAVRVLQRVHELPAYVRKTARLSGRALAVREALASATDPTLLLFQDLPRACGLGSFLTDAPDAGRFGRPAPGGAPRPGRRLPRAPGRDRGRGRPGVRPPREHVRRPPPRAGGARARALLPAASSLSLKAFLVRATDEILDTGAWLESLAALLARRPPAQWTDEDRGTFGIALREMAGAFLRLEPLALDLASDPDDGGGVRRVRLFVQTLRESEHAGVVHVHPEDDALVDALHARLEDALGDDATADVQLAALSRLAADLLRQRDPTFGVIHDE